MSESIISAHTIWALIVSMLFGGLLGGFVNYIMTREAQDTENGANGKVQPVSLVRSVLIGLAAALLVPLFLNMTSSNLIEEIRGGPNTLAQPSKLFVFVGFCLAAAISSRAFIRAMSDRLAIDIARKADERSKHALTRADEAEENFAQKTDEGSKLMPTEAAHGEENFGRLLFHPPTKRIIETAYDDFVRLTSREPTVISAEPDPLSDAAEPEPVSDNEQWVLTKIADSGYRFRTTAGLAIDTKLTTDELDQTLSSLLTKGMVGQRTGKKGALWYIKNKGQKAIR